MSGFFRPRNLVVAGGAISILFFVPSLSGSSQGGPNPFNTREAQNITDRFNSGGGANTHTPGAATPRGSKDNIESPQQTKSGPDSAAFRDGHEDQRVAPQNAIDKAWNKAHYGNERGK
ncbi:MAG: hypothetical protein Q9165_001602 [Trypethelium subeluteriae]